MPLLANAASVAFAAPLGPTRAFGLLEGVAGRCQKVLAPLMYPAPEG